MIALAIARYAAGSRISECTASTIARWDVPTSRAVPASTPSGRSVDSRMTRTGLPRLGASSWTPPLSVTTTVQMDSSRVKSG